jgi:HK97 family phage major capsid protein
MADTISYTLPVEFSNLILEKAAEESVFLKIAEQHGRLSRLQRDSGEQVTISIDDGEADWQGSPDVDKTVNAFGLDSKNVVPVPLARIIYARKSLLDDETALRAHIMDSLPNSIWRAFDRTVAGLKAAPNATFIPVSEATTSIELNDTDTSLYQKLIDGKKALYAFGYQDTDFVLSKVFGTLVEGEVDTLGRPLLTSLAENGHLVRVPAHESINIMPPSPTPESTITYGFLGDFKQAVAGIVGAVTVDVNPYESQAWKRNQVALRVEVPLAYSIASADAFVKYVWTTPKA